MTCKMAFVLGAALMAATPGVWGQTPTPAPAPKLDQLRLPTGFEIAIYAGNVANARQMALAPDGTVFVGSQRPGNVYAITDTNKNGRADAVLTIATGLNTPNGVAFRNGSLYVAEINRVLRFDNVLDIVKAKRTLTQPAIVNDTFPSDRPHGWKYIECGPDGLLYVPVGAPCNVCERPSPYASIMRMKPDGSGLETFASGVRNTVGFTWHPSTREMWFTENGRDQLGDETPNDELNHAPRLAYISAFRTAMTATSSILSLARTVKRAANMLPPPSDLGHTLPHSASSSTLEPPSQPNIATSSSSSTMVHGTDPSRRATLATA